jgi:hypothetical protein
MPPYIVGPLSKGRILIKDLPGSLINEPGTILHDQPSGLRGLKKLYVLTDSFFMQLTTSQKDIIAFVIPPVFTLIHLAPQTS